MLENISNLYTLILQISLNTVLCFLPPFRILHYFHVNPLLTSKNFPRFPKTDLLPSIHFPMKTHDFCSKHDRLGNSREKHLDLTFVFEYPYKMCCINSFR